MTEPREPAAGGRRRTSVRRVLLVLVVVLVGACAGDDSDATPDGSGDTPDETTEPLGGDPPDEVDTPDEADPPGADVGETAVWRVDDRDPPDDAATSFTALVTRLGCNGGVTGTVLEPVVTADAERITVTFAVEPVSPGVHTCPGNDGVPFAVELADPVAGRELVDGACLSGDAVTTSFCTEGPVRWSPQP